MLVLMLIFCIWLCREWAGEYTLCKENNIWTAVFKTKAAFDAASNQLAGGLRGQFKILKPAKPKPVKDEANRSNTPGQTSQQRYGSWVPVRGNNQSGRGWASIVKSEERIPDPWDDPDGGKEASYLVLRNNRKVRCHRAVSFCSIYCPIGCQATSLKIY